MINSVVSGFLYFLGSLISVGFLLGIFVYYRNQIRCILKSSEKHGKYLMTEMRLGKWGAAAGFIITTVAIVLEICSLPIKSAFVGSACLMAFTLLQIAARIFFKLKER